MNSTSERERIWEMKFFDEEAMNSAERRRQPYVFDLVDQVLHPTQAVADSQVGSGITVVSVTEVINSFCSSLSK